jgi:hypothetical protein
LSTGKDEQPGSYLKFKSPKNTHQIPSCVFQLYVNLSCI